MSELLYKWKYIWNSSANMKKQLFFLLLFFILKSLFYFKDILIYVLQTNLVYYNHRTASVV